MQDEKVEVFRYPMTATLGRAGAIFAIVFAINAVSIVRRNPDNAMARVVVLLGAFLGVVLLLSFGLSVAISPNGIGRRRGALIPWKDIATVTRARTAFGATYRVQSPTREDFSIFAVHLRNSRLRDLVDEHAPSGHPIRKVLDPAAGV